MRRAHSHFTGLLAGVGVVGVMRCATPLALIERPISFSPRRVALTQEYLQQHYGVTAANIEIVPRVIVLHWTAIDDLQKSFAAFETETLPAARADLAGAGQLNVSIQFVVDSSGVIYRLMPENWMARHCIGLNYDAIGVENVGGGKGIDNLTEAQVRANVQLVRYLKRKYATIAYLIGHYEYREFEHHALWREKDSDYRTAKSDPGPRFMHLVRAGVADLHLKGSSEIRAEKSQQQEQGGR